MTWRVYVKYLDFPQVFAKWLRYRNCSLKDSKIAQKKLQGWEKTVSIHLKEAGNLTFRFRKGYFQKLTKTPKAVDIEFTTDLETYTKILRNVLSWKETVRQKKLVVQKGEASDIEMLNRIFHWRWDD
jgi:recombinational DNA repair ATPase RecF